MKKLFVLVRTDLNPAYRAVQAGHAVAEFVLNRPNTWANEILVYLGVKSLFSLEVIKDKFEKQQIDYVEFREPDLENQLTAIATVNENKIVTNLNLLKDI